jgi:hypothetical protein
MMDGAKLIKRLKDRYGQAVIKAEEQVLQRYMQLSKG